MLTIVWGPNSSICKHLGTEKSGYSTVLGLLCHNLHFNMHKICLNQNAGRSVQNPALLKYARPSLKKMPPGQQHVLLLNLAISLSIDGTIPDVHLSRPPL